MQIKTLLNKQQLLNQKMGNPMDRNGWEASIKENLLALIVEATEVLDEINWKPWKKTTKRINHQKLREEIIDILQFWGNIVNSAGFTAEEMEREYARKYQICLKRIEENE